MVRQILIIAASLAALAAMAVVPFGPAEAKPKWKDKHYAVKGGPPPWAPAHGYRRKQRHGGYAYRGGYDRY